MLVYMRYDMLQMEVKPKVFLWQRALSDQMQETKQTRTVVAGCNVSQSVIPPLIVFDRMFLKPEYTYDEVPRTSYALSASGWIAS